MSALDQILTWMKKRSSTSAELAKQAAAELAALRAERDALKAELAKILLRDFQKGNSMEAHAADEVASKFWDTWQEVEAALKGDA